MRRRGRRRLALKVSHAAFVEQLRQQPPLAIAGSRTAAAVHEDSNRHASDGSLGVHGGAEIVAGPAAAVMDIRHGNDYATALTARGMTIEKRRTSVLFVLTKVVIARKAA